MKKLFILSIFSFLFIYSSCSSGSENPTMNPPPPSNNVTYTNTVKSIIDNNCIRCHSDPPVNNAPMPLTTFTNVRDAVQSRGLITRVANGTMPPDGAADLTAAQVQAIRDWQSGGFVE